MECASTECSHVANNTRVGGRTELSHEARLHEAMQHQCESHVLLPSVVSPSPPFNLNRLRSSIV